MTIEMLKLYNSKELAEAMKVHPTYISAMKRAGYQFEYGHQTTPEHAMAWRKANPDFTKTTAYPAKAKKRPSKAKAREVVPS
jgi:hypothetical protein